MVFFKYRFYLGGEIWVEVWVSWSLLGKGWDGVFLIEMLVWVKIKRYDLFLMCLEIRKIFSGVV